ncbi:MAG: DNA primase [Candidatus Veblenbacteria bacterium RIFOXYC2_FULL_42_11]|uniref:DNA primase n=1 Tax=Candidatus Veblenbacteria bacterium RIFOXYC2_FULL_42_11 TaxID=1802428 RepID=A0A1G2Q999_9BACT|nr:MAG: DNA primase [Candidatus Veblenbacteria bacterium RIFOXYC2_FULL_42_11]
MPNDVDTIKSRLDVVDVIGEYVSLKQSGQNWKGLCPFHGEKTPSFMVHREKQIWHCFGCGLGGDIFEFIEKFENVDFPEALEILARKAGVELSREVQPGASNKRTRLFQLLSEAVNFYQEQLKSDPGSSARQYLASRGVTAESISSFALGYAPAEWDKLANYLRNKGFSLEELIAAGVALKSERGPGIYDRFRDRLLFPIFDVQDRAVGFGGRTLDPNAKEAKYINSPQTAIYNKSFVLYNLNQAKSFIKDSGYAVVVEGYMDVISSWQAGIKNIVAVSGTALVSETNYSKEEGSGFKYEQVKLLKRYCNEIRLCFDADLAGQSASERGIDLALAAELEVKIVALSQGKDPDEAARMNLVKFKQEIEQALPIGEYAFKSVFKKVDVKTREGKKQAAKFLLAAIAKLPDPVERDFYIKRLARDLDVEEKSLRESLPNPRMSNQISAPVATPQASRPSREQMLSERLIALLIKFGKEFWPQTTGLEPAMLTEPEAELYRQAHLQYTESQRVDFEELKRELNYEPTYNRLIDILGLQAEHEFAEFTAAEATKEFNQVNRELKLNYLKRQLKLLSDAISQAERAQQPGELEELSLRYREVADQLAQLQR